MLCESALKELWACMILLQFKVRSEWCVDLIPAQAPLGCSQPGCKNDIFLQLFPFICVREPSGAHFEAEERQTYELRDHFVYPLCVNPS